MGIMKSILSEEKVKSIFELFLLHPSPQRAYHKLSTSVFCRKLIEDYPNIIIWLSHNRENIKGSINSRNFALTLDYLQSLAILQKEKDNGG